MTKKDLLIGGIIQGIREEFEKCDNDVIAGFAGRNMKCSHCPVNKNPCNLGECKETLKKYLEE